MVTAGEAFAATASLTVNHELNIVRRAIAESLPLGKYDCRIPRRHLSPLTIRALKKLGYRVRLKPHVVVSWR